MANDDTKIPRRTIVVAGCLASLGCGRLIRPVFGGEDRAANGGKKRQLPDRLEFVKRLAGVQPEYKQDTVVRLVGKPDEIRRGPFRESHLDDEVWCYGTDGLESLATLGEVYFRRGYVSSVAGGRGKPPASGVIEEGELRAGMRFLHVGANSTFLYDPLRLIRVVNYLRGLGKDKALAIVGEYARIGLYGITNKRWLFFLLRILFDVLDPPGHMPKLTFGAMTPSPPKDATRIPRFPIVIVDDVPFSLLSDVTLFGQTEPVSRHVEYFRKHGTVQSENLRPPDDPYSSFRKLLRSDAWNYAVDEVGRQYVPDFGDHILLQVLALARTAYEPAELRQHFAYVKLSAFDRHHQAYLDTGARWDEKLQLYGRRDGTHGEIERVGKPT